MQNQRYLHIPGMAEPSKSAPWIQAVRDLNAIESEKQKIAEEQTRNKYLDPSLAAGLYKAQTENRYLDPTLAAKLQVEQAEAKYKAPTLAALLQQHNLTNQGKSLENKYLPGKLSTENELNLTKLQRERQLLQTLT